MSEPRRGVEAGLVALGLAIFAATLAFVGVADLFARLRAFEVGPFVVYLALSSAVAALHAFRWGILSRAAGAAVPFPRLLGARLAGDAVGSLVPTVRIAGDPVRATLVLPEGGRLSSTIAGVALDRLVETLANVVCATLYVTLFLSIPWTLGDGAVSGDVSNGAAMALGGLGFLLLSLALVLGFLRAGWSPIAGTVGRWRPGPTRPRLRRIREAGLRLEAELGRFLRDRPRLFWGAFALMLATEGLVILEYFFLLAAFQVALPWPMLLMVLVATGFALATPTPGGLGALEAGQVALLVASGASAETGLAVGIAIRIHEALWAAVGLGALSSLGTSPRRVRDLAARLGVRA